MLLLSLCLAAEGKSLYLGSSVTAQGNSRAAFTCALLVLPKKPDMRHPESLRHHHKPGLVAPCPGEAVLNGTSLPVTLSQLSIISWCPGSGKSPSMMTHESCSAFLWKLLEAKAEPHDRDSGSESPAQEGWWGGWARCLNLALSMTGSLSLYQFHIAGHRPKLTVFRMPWDQQIPVCGPPCPDVTLNGPENLCHWEITLSHACSGLHS